VGPAYYRHHVGSGAKKKHTPGNSGAAKKKQFVARLRKKCLDLSRRSGIRATGRTKRATTLPASGGDRVCPCKAKVGGTWSTYREDKNDLEPTSTGNRPSLVKRAPWSTDPDTFPTIRHRKMAFVVEKEGSGVSQRKIHSTLKASCPRIGTRNGFLSLTSNPYSTTLQKSGKSIKSKKTSGSQIWV